MYRGFFGWNGVGGNVHVYLLLYNTLNISLSHSVFSRLYATVDSFHIMVIT
jgi:hypothetical protein